ncbi:BTB/POZ domain-containing protein At5g48800-like [Lolium perenne]|uniref:BTB/POZ domain-containing protein At5g48800-like n=1 Tax=Lolium perenne TaxID=4522 RepID=UPI003A999303
MAQRSAYSCQGLFWVLRVTSSEKMRKVGRLVGKYLAKISPDHGLGVSRFLAIAESLPDSARVFYDGVYKAWNIYLERLMHIVASSLYVLTGVTIGGGGTLISVYLDDLTILSYA